MKTKEVIRQLMEADPTGEEEVCVENIDIHFIHAEPAYYDGALQVLTRDPTSKYYNITGGKYRRSGTKIVIKTLSITDAISNAYECEKDCQIDYSELSERDQVETKKAHDQLREWHRKLDIELEWDNFYGWVKEQAAKVTADTDHVEGAAKRFFTQNISPGDPYEDGKIPLGHSYVSMRRMQWDRDLEVLMDDGFLRVRRKISEDPDA
jgi:hypothetical protein